MVKFDTEETGLGIVLKDYQVVSLKVLWEIDRIEKGKGGSSRDVWVQCNVGLQGIKTISRASVINFLNSMVDINVLSYHEITGKGGHRRIYKPVYDEEGTKVYLAKMILGHMKQEWPEALEEAIKSL